MTTINGFIDQTCQMADQTLGRNDYSYLRDGKQRPENISQPAYNSHVHYMYPSYYPMGGFFGPSYHRETVYVDSGRYSGGSRGKDNSNNFLIGAVAVGVGLATSYFVGKDWALQGNAENDLNRLVDKKELVDAELKTKNDPELEAKVNYVFNKQKKVFELVKDDAKWGFRTKAALAGSMGVLLLGACLDAYTTTAGGTAATFATAAKVTGTVAGVASAGAILFRMGFNETSNHLQREAEDIAEVADALRQQGYTNVTA